MSANVKIVAFVCENHAMSAIRAASVAGESIPDSVRIVEMPCTGRLETSQMLDAMGGGADGVVVIGCLEENCYHDVGSALARERVNRIKDILKDISIEPERVEMINSASVSGAMLMSKLRQFESRISALPALSLTGVIK
jgi:coenzyme F420-reducing hydrogenase delta subunit